MPKTPWSGYGRFCPLARALDVIGDRWTLIIVQELLKRPSRYGELASRLPGIGSSVLADRLRSLEQAGVVERRAGPVGGGVVYALTPRGERLDNALAALRQWGVEYLTDPTADGSDCRTFNVRYVKGIEALGPAEFGLVIGGVATTLRFAAGSLELHVGGPANPQLVVSADAGFMRDWAAGRTDWDRGRADGRVAVDGDDSAWPQFLAATGYRLQYEPEIANG